MARKPKNSPGPADHDNGSSADKPILIRIHLAERPDMEARFVNHIVANFNGTEFLLSLAQAIPPADREGAEWKRTLSERRLDAALIARVAIPVDKFVEMVEAFGHMVNDLRAKGFLPPAGGEASGN